MRAPVPLGAVVGPYRILSLLAEGAMGTVYVAEGPNGEHVALKILLAPLAEDARFRERFLRETDLAARLHHPRIVSTIASGEHDGILWLAMELVDGVDLRTLLKREGALEPRRAIGLLSQVAEALDVAHAAGLVHRDVKPGNILVRGEDAYLCDFGLARHVSSVSSLTSERGFVGTIDYVAPEQIQGGTLDRRADVYALGCVLFECLGGARPYEADSDLTTLFAHLNEPPPRISDLNPALPAALDDVIARALAKAPDDRCATCGELIAAATAALEGRTVATGRRRRGLLVAAAGLVAGAAALGAVVATHDGSGARTSAVPPRHVIPVRTDVVSLVDPRTRRVASTVSLGPRAPWCCSLDDIEFTRRSAWLAFSGEPRIAEVDLRTRKLARIVALPWGAGGAGAPIALLDGSVWVPQGLGSGLLRIDARSGRIRGRYRLTGEALNGAVEAAGSLWLSADTGVLRVDPATGRVLRRIAFAAPVTSILSADGYVWAASGSTGLVAKIDPHANRLVKSTRLHGWLPAMTVGGGFVWVSFIPDGQVFQLAEADLSVLQSYPAGPTPQTLGYGGSGVWVTDPDANTVSLIDAATGHRSTFAVSSSPQLVRFHRGLLWTSGQAPTPPLRAIAGQQLRISMPQGLIDADPSDGMLPHDAQLFYATCANLYRYPDSSGPAGARLVPEIAAAMPTVSPDGRTYTIRVRRGFRFSPPSNEPVVAETFRHTIERALSPKLKDSPAAPFVSDLVGVDAYRAGRTPHIAGIRVRGDTISFRLVRPSGDFLARISLWYFCPVPLSEPVVPSGLTGPVPSAGPYYQSQIVGERTVLLPNPNYHGNRPRRSARIVYTTHFPTAQAVALADAGKTDLLPSDFDRYSELAPGGPLERAYGAGSPAAKNGHERYFLQARSFDYEIVFNAGRPLFRDLRNRKAVSEALNRRALAGAFQAQPSDQLLPAAVTKTRRDSVASPRVTSIGGARDAVLYAPCDYGASEVPDLIRTELAPLGIRVSIVATRACSDTYTDEARRADLVLAWLGQPVENDPEPFLDGSIATGDVGSALGPGPWNAPSFRRRVEAARRLRGDARSDAYRKLASEFMRAFPVAVFGSVVWPMYVSPKLGCLTFQAHYGFLDLGLLCKRS